MKAIWIMHDIALTEDIQRLLEDEGVVGVSRWPRMVGRGPQTGARFDNHVWPGANAGWCVVLEDSRAAALLARLAALRRARQGRAGLWAFTTPVLETLDEKDFEN